MWIHSTGRSERSSWMAANSGCTSAQNSPSHSVMRIRASRSALPARNGCAISQAWAPRARGSRSSSSRRSEVPDRAGPVMTIGSTIRSLAIAGRRFRSSVRRRRVRRQRMISSRVISRPRACIWAVSSIASTSPSRRARQSPSKSPKSRRSVDSVADSVIASTSSGTSLAAPPTASPIAMIRRAQSGRARWSPRFVILLMCPPRARLELTARRARPTRGSTSVAWPEWNPALRPSRPWPSAAR
jgi:hypothetical protein